MADLVTTVVIPTHNAARTLGAQLDALVAQQTTRGFEVVVVDNRSTDDPAAVVAGYSSAAVPVRLVSAPDRAGAGYARNCGVAVARGDRVLFCDADDTVGPGWVETMTRALDTADLCGGAIRVDRVNSPEVRSWAPSPPAADLPVCMKYLPYALSSNLGFRLSVLQDLGGFDESFVAGHEEVDLCWRAQQAGFPLVFVPDAEIDYTLRSTVRATMKQRFAYGRSYAQLYSTFAADPIPRLSGRHEVKVVGLFLLSGLREYRAGTGANWLVGLAWIAGRWRGNLAHRVRCPL